MKRPSIDIRDTSGGFISAHRMTTGEIVLTMDTLTVTLSWREAKFVRECLHAVTGKRNQPLAFRKLGEDARPAKSGPQSERRRSAALQKTS